MIMIIIIIDDDDDDNNNQGFILKQWSTHSFNRVYLIVTRALVKIVPS